MINNNKQNIKIENNEEIYFWKIEYKFFKLSLFVVFLIFFSFLFLEAYLFYMDITQGMLNEELKLKLMILEKRYAHLSKVPFYRANDIELISQIIKIVMFISGSYSLALVGPLGTLPFFIPFISVFYSNLSSIYKQSTNDIAYNGILKEHIKITRGDDGTTFFIEVLINGNFVPLSQFISEHPELVEQLIAL